MPSPALSYREAHEWEPYAAAKKVSTVARSSRGFMRAYEQARSFAKLSPYWKKRREGFIARHMAQVKLNGERLWKHDVAGVLRPSRRCLALLMWAFMPARDNPMKPIHSNPPWSDKILGKHWAALEARVGASWMPVVLTVNREYASALKDFENYGAIDETWAKNSAALAASRMEKFKGKKPKGYQEYGSGHYGCVMPTRTPGLVIKVTTDASEAAFVAAYLSLKPSMRPSGIVTYHRLIAIRSASHLKRPVFVLWRDEAEYVGKIGEWINEGSRDFEKDYNKRSFRIVANLIGKCLDAGRLIRKLTLKAKDPKALITEGLGLMDDAWEDPLRSLRRGKPWALAVHLSAFKRSAEDLQNEPMGSYLGEALSESFDLGLLLADVHLNNIGMPSAALADEIGHTPIITDPGHAIALSDRFSGVQIEEL